MFEDTIDIPPRVEGFEFELNVSYKMKDSREAIIYDQNLIQTSDMVVDIESIELNEIEKLIELGIDRVLSSGQKKTAIEGLDLLLKLKNISKNRLVIMPGSGISKNNLKNFTLFKEVHGSFKNEINSNGFKLC